MVEPLRRYEVRHLVAHLEAAGRGADVHRVLDVGDESPLWFAAKDSEGDLEGFLADVRRGLRLAAGRPGLRARYALVLASAADYAVNVPRELVAALVAGGVWSPDLGLASVRQITDPAHRVTALAALAPHLPAALLRDAAEAELRALAGSPHDVERATAVGGLFAVLPDDLADEALAVAERLDEWERTYALEGRLPVSDRVLALAESIGSAELRARALAAVGTRAPDDLVSRIAGAAQGIEDPAFRPLALSGVADRVPVDTVRAVLEQAAGHGWAVWQAVRSPRFPVELHDRALAAVHDTRHWIDVLVALAPRMTEATARRALRGLRSHDNVHGGCEALVALTPSLSTVDLTEALELAEGLEFPWSRVRAVTAVAVRHPDRDRLVRELWRQARTLRVYLYSDGDAAAALIAVLPDDLVADALAFASTAAHTGMTAVVAAVRRSGDGTAALDAVRATVRINDEHAERRLALRALAPVLTPDQLAEAVVVAQQPSVGWYYGDDYHGRGSVRERLAELAPFLDRDRLTAALGAARQVRDTEARCVLLAAFASHVPVAEHGFALVRDTPDVTRRAVMLTALAPHLTEAERRTALDLVADFPYEEPRVRALAGLSAHVPESVDRVLDLLDRPSYGWWTAEVVRNLARWRPELWERALAEVLRVDPEVVDGQGKALRPLADVVPVELLPRVVDLARRVGVAHGAATLGVVGRRLADRDLVREAVGLAARLHQPGDRARLLVAIGEHRKAREDTEVWTRAMMSGEVDDDWFTGVSVFLALLPTVRPSEARRVLRVAAGLRGAESRARVVESVAPLLADGHFTAALDVLGDDGRAAARALVALARRFPERADELWGRSEVLWDNGSRREVAEVLGELAELMVLVGGPEAAREVVAAVVRVGTWFP
ncbi:hypothetical protein [Actinosynnema sp. NPDC020468]|uniref:hypothetical protein n=1 Tax=Actinosynnema sp. NPDC020468 TaxID=3154488 RepID=UPI0033FFD89E